jgi:hypothetical protein
MQSPETLKAPKNEATDSFSMVQAAIMVFLMVLFVGATIYVLISSLM